MADEDIHMEARRRQAEAVAAERERCAKIIEEIPASASLYENAETAKAVIAFKKYAVELIKGE